MLGPDTPEEAWKQVEEQMDPDELRRLVARAAENIGKLYGVHVSDAALGRIILGLEDEV